MTQRLARSFEEVRARRRVAVLPYFVAGYPTFRSFRERLLEAREAGVAGIEIGFPFSDPVADGPAIAQVHHEALEAGVTVRKILSFVRDLRHDGFDTPLVGMAYANLLEAPGRLRSARAWAQAGFDAAIIPDLPLDEAHEWRTMLGREHLGLVAFAGPTTPAARMRKALASQPSFLYLIAAYGTTGARSSLPPEAPRLVRGARRARGRHGPPLVVGFGVSTPQHVKAYGRLGADGVIVGSALVPHVAQRRNVAPFLRHLVGASSASTKV